MKKERNKFITAMLGSSIVLLIVSVVVAGSLYAYMHKTVSWFAKNTDVEGKGMDVTIEEIDSLHINRILVYKYLLTDEYVTVVKEEDPSSPKFMTLNEYDTIFTERQKYTPIVLKVPVENTKGKPFIITLESHGDLLDKTTGYMAANISNIISVRCGISSDLDDIPNTEDQATAGTFYDAAQEFLTETGVEVLGTDSDPIVDGKVCEKKFVTKSGDKFSKESSYSFCFGNNTPKLYTGQSQPQLNVYFYIDYDPVLAQKFLDDNITINVEFLEDNTVVFTNDIDYMIFGHKSDTD